MDERFRPITKFSERRSFERDTLLTGVLLGLALSLLTVELVELTIWLRWTLALSFLILVIGEFARQRLGAGHSRIELEGIIFLLQKANDPKKADGYRFSENVKRWVEGCANFDPEFASAWKNRRIEPGHFLDRSVTSNDRFDKANLFRQLVEYFVMDRLSVQVSSYFQRRSDLDEEELVTIRRSDLPDQLVKSNYFFDVLSDETDVKASERVVKGGMSYTTVLVSGDVNGRPFSRFDLTLPKGTSIEYSDSGEISLRNKLFDVHFRPSFRGFNAVVPVAFQEKYMGVPFDDPETLTPWQVDIAIEFSMRPRAILTQRGWAYQSWLEEFVLSLEHEFVFEKFLDSINWASVQATLHSLRSTSLFVNAIESNQTVGKGLMEVMKPPMKPNSSEPHPPRAEIIDDPGPGVHL